VYLHNVRHRFPPWLVLPLLAGLCVGIIFAVAYLRSRSFSTANLLQRLPSEDAVVLYVDFEAMRRVHLLDLVTAAAAAQEPEYRSFVESTGFNYLRDLDSALVSFHASGKYLLLRGRFDWSNLSQYVRGQGGTCYNTMCRLDGSTPERKISYFPLQPNIMALAVSADDTAATRLQGRRSGPRPEILADPIWLLIPPTVLKDEARLPAGLSPFARALWGTQRVVLSGGPDGSGMRLQLDATCSSAEQAATLASQLRALTTLFRQLIAREHQIPNPRDLSGILAAGVFEQKGRRVLGSWPVQRAFLESLAGSAL
jgi:hypothetical protein